MLTLDLMRTGLGHLQKGVPALGQVAREMGLEERPGTFQARCGPFKGRGPQLAQGARGHARLGHVFSDVDFGEVPAVRDGHFVRTLQTLRLWVVDPALDVDLVVRPSQLKYHSPVASEPLDFEVCLGEMEKTCPPSNWSQGKKEPSF